MTTWVKPNKTEIELNDLPATIKAAKANKWKLKDEKKETPKKEEAKQKVS